MNFSIEDARPDQTEEMLALFPRLADYELPSRRTPEELWKGDAELAKKWAQGGLPEAIFKVAVDHNSVVLGVAFAQLRPEALSLKPSAHLEVLTVSKEAEGHGVGKALVEAVEQDVKSLGATSLTLNVLCNNLNARGFYQHLGFEEELLRCIKDI